MVGIPYRQTVAAASLSARRQAAASRARLCFPPRRKMHARACAWETRFRRLARTTSEGPPPSPISTSSPWCASCSKAPPNPTQASIARPSSLCVPAISHCQPKVRLTGTSD